jgi:hypothetical protein
LHGGEFAQGAYGDLIAQERALPESDAGSLETMFILGLYTVFNATVFNATVFNATVFDATVFSATVLFSAVVALPSGARWGDLTRSMSAAYSVGPD